ncbi:hypothetical protein A9Q78_09970 [Methylophaga sp. 41_12_T18]|nr:hypothetical protein A9Q78_09970 [Methylophaga sp. 41_12_T18]
MTINQHELLSALVDGELQGDELEQALLLLDSDEQLRAQFQRYQYSSDVMHGNNYQHSHIDLTKGIAQALVSEQTFTKQGLIKHKAALLAFPKQFWTQAASLAMAASVGALAVVGITSQSQNQFIATSAVVASAAANNTGNGNRWTVGEPEIEDRLNTYLVDHNEYAGASGVFSYARLVSYEAGQ